MVSTVSTQFAVSAGNIPRVTVPALPIGATSWSLYLTPVGGAPGTQTRQQSGLTGLTVDQTAIYAAGQVPPTTNGATINKRITIQMAGRITAMSRVGGTQEQEQFIREVTFSGERDTGWGRLFKITVVNGESVLRGAA